MKDLCADDAIGTAHPFWPPEPPVLLACLDAQHERLGRSHISHLHRRRGNGGPTRVVTWSLEQFERPTYLMLATLDALEADLIVLATAGQLPLSEELRLWIDQWSARRRGRPGTLTAVLTGATPATTADWPDYARLGDAARRCGLEYLVYASELYPVANAAFLLDGVQRFASRQWSVFAT
jgi:hypothetical protein